MTGMERDFRGAYREFTVDTIFSPEYDVEKRHIIWKTRPKFTDGLADPENEELIQIAEHGINIVSQRDVRRNVRKSLEIAVDLAAEGRRVLYVNSYAGLGMLRENLIEQLQRYPAEPPPGPLPRSGRGQALEKEGEIECDSTSEESGFRTDLPIRFLDCKIGMWDKCWRAIRRTMESIEVVPDPEDPTSETEQKLPALDVLVFNSYEFSAFEYYARVLMCEQLLRWTYKFPITVILFTQTVRAVMEPGVPVRGPLGLLTSSAHTLSKLGEPLRGRTKASVETEPGIHESVPKIKNKIKLYYNGAGVLEAVEYPKDYRGHRYELGFFPRDLLQAVPAGVDAVQLVGAPPKHLFTE